MRKKPDVCIVRTAGTNCDRETGHAFSVCGGSVDYVHVNSLVSRERSLDDFHILALPGGFSYGDDVASGRIFANELRCKLADALKKFIADGKLIIGICNGFQILVKSGLLPGSGGMRQEASLIINDSGKFECRWVYLRSKVEHPAIGEGPVCASAQGRRWKESKCVWTKGLPEVIYLPVAHGEGKFIVRDGALLERLKKDGRIVFRYCTAEGACGGYPHNPNGSTDDIAGICDETGRILGLMPHPERHAYARQHPRRAGAACNEPGDGMQIFRNGVAYAQERLCRG